MSFEVVPSEHVCYVHCNFCNTILAVSVPLSNLFNFVTVRCGHCASLLSVNMGLQSHNLRSLGYSHMCGSSSRGSTIPTINSAENDQHQLLIRRPPEKRQRVPSTYNRFIKEEIQRIKANNPAISHREAFSSAAKNWAHLPHLQCGANFDGDKEGKLEEATTAKGAPKSKELC